MPKSYYTLNVRSRGKQVVLFSRESWCFPRGSGGKHQDYVERHVWTWVINRATSPSNSFCSILLLNNSHVFLLLKKQPLLHDFSSTVSCAFFALTFNSTEWKKTLIRLSLSMRPEVVRGRCILDKALLTCLNWKWKISRHLLFLCFKVTKCY